mmetsp:Transcript_22347/g.70025  ORF Transcript_22347/g.70025 Transcript_22347/m.70025 type:complete len:388 (+) Transcript_22347:71-1234(+)
MPCHILATFGVDPTSQVLAVGSATPLKTCPRVASIRFYTAHLAVVRSALDLWGLDLLGPDALEAVRGLAAWISDTSDQPSAFDRTRGVLDAIAARLEAPAPATLEGRALLRARYLMEAVHGRSRRCAVVLAADVALAAASAASARAKLAHRNAGLDVFAARRAAGVAVLEKSVGALLRRGRVPNAIQAAAQLRREGAAAGRWTKAGVDETWLSRAETFRNDVPGPLYQPGSSAVLDVELRKGLRIAPASDHYEVIVEKPNGSTCARQLTRHGAHVIGLEPGKMPPGDYRATVLDARSVPRRTILDKAPFSVNHGGNAFPAVLRPPVRAIELRLSLGGRPCADYDVALKVKAAAEFDDAAAGLAFEKLRIAELRDALTAAGASSDGRF